MQQKYSGSRSTRNDEAVLTTKRRRSHFESFFASGGSVVLGSRASICVPGHDEVTLKPRMVLPLESKKEGP